VPTPADVLTPAVFEGSDAMNAATSSDLPGGGCPTDTVKERLACGRRVKDAGPDMAAQEGRRVSSMPQLTSGASVEWISIASGLRESMVIL
jgi:hypothetical protein